VVKDVLCSFLVIKKEGNHLEWLQKKGYGLGSGEEF
jgi:hypothetical protein